MFYSKLISNIVLLLTNVIIHMLDEEKKVSYPQNIYLKGLIAVSAETSTSLANKIGVSREVVSLTINGHYKGDNIVPKILEVLGTDFLEQYKDLIPKQ